MRRIFQRIPAAMLAVFCCLLPAQAQKPPPNRTVSFLLTDAMVKGKRLAGVEVLVTQGAGAEQVASGRTDGDGVFSVRLQRGRYRASYRLRGYVPLERSAIEVRRKGQLITTAMTPLLEVSGKHGRTRVQFVLSWDSGRKAELNADAHIYRPDLKPPLHLHWRRRAYKAGEFEAALDQDAKGGGGPETLTLLDPPAGRYAYFVHAPGSRPGAMYYFRVRVQVILDDRLLAEAVIPQACDGQVWRPFHHLFVGKDGKVAAIDSGPGEQWRCRFPQASELKSP